MTPIETIASIDETLKTYSEALEDAKDERKPFWKKKIDALLDSRFEQMNLRDSKTK